MPQKYNQNINILTTILLITVAISGCTTQKDTFDFKETDMKYYEFVYEDTECKDECLTEYIVHSNGLVFPKKETNTGGMINTEIYIGIIDKKKAETLIERTKTDIGNTNTEGIDCDSCQLYHIFYGEKEITRSFTTRTENAPGFFKDIEENTSQELKTQTPLEPFFIHLIFKKPKENAIDYHFFPDGTVLKEQFGERNGELLSSAIYTISQKDMDAMKQSTTNDIFASSDNLDRCDKNNLEWGYIEIQKGTSYKLIYTCGTGNSRADKLFSELLKKTGAR